VSGAHFQLFVKAIQGSDPELTHENSPALKLLCDEFKFADLGRKVEAFTGRWTYVAFEAETVHILRDKLVQTCSKFRDCPSLLTQPYEITSPVAADIFRAFVKTFGGVSLTITNENITDIGLLCEEFGHEQLSAIVSDFLAQYSSPADRACREIATLKAQNAAFTTKVTALTTQGAALVTQIADLAARHLREVAQLKNEIKQLKRRNRLFPPLVKKGGQFDVPDGIIAQLTRECGGNVHDRHLEVTSGSFANGANPHSWAYDNWDDRAPKNVADMETSSCFESGYRFAAEDIPHTRNNWVCYDLKERSIVLTDYTIRTHDDDSGGEHLKSWLVETSADGENWREVGREEDNKQLNGNLLTGTFAIAGGVKCRFIRLVNIGRNHYGSDCLMISAWEIFGRLIE
jgi:hypothetical protein